MGIRNTETQSTYPKPPNAVVANLLPAAATTIPATGDKGRRSVEVGGWGRSELTANNQRGLVRPDGFGN